MHPLQQTLLSFLILVSHCFFASAEQKNGHEIVFKIAVKENTKARIGYFEGSKFKMIDSTFFIQNNAVLKGTNELPQGLYLLQYDGISLDFVVSEQHFTIEKQTESDFQITNSMSNLIFFNYKNEVRQKKELLKKTKHSPQNEKEIGAKIAHYRDSIFTHFPQNLACKIIRAGIEPKSKQESNKQKRELQFSNIDMSDARMINTPYLESRILKSLKLSDYIPDSLAKTSDFILEKAKTNELVYKYCMSFLKDYFEKSNQPWMDVLYTYLAKKYYLEGKASWADTNEILTIKANLKRMEPILTGRLSPPIEFMDTLGRVIPLYSIKAKYTILYFWDADCSHCQEITPKLWEYYKTIKDKEVEVYAVTTQQIYYSWQDYLRKHQMNWINVYEPFKIQEVYNTFQVGLTPCIFLLDKDKRILCKRISMEELKSYLKMLL